MTKSPMDELFFELFGYYPTKAGQAYEMIVAAVFKLLRNEDVEYDRHIIGEYSGSDYQLDGLIKGDDGQSMIEAKDYTLDKRKVGRGDAQKLQGGLTDLPVNKGVLASATEFTKPAKQYAVSSNVNPLQKPIDLYNIRPSTKTDEKGRVKQIIINLQIHIPDYEHGKFEFNLTESGLAKLADNGLLGKPLSLRLENIYDKQGNIITTIKKLSESQSPSTTWEDGYISVGSWAFENGYFEYENQLYGISAITYEIPFITSREEFVIESNGSPKIYIKAEDGAINKLITDTDLKKVRFENGKVLI